MNVEGNKPCSAANYVMKKYISLAILLLSAVYTFAQTCEIKGTSKPVMRQFIYLFSIEDGEPKMISSAKLAEDGSFRFSFTPAYEGFYVLGAAKLMGGQHPLYVKAGDKLEVAI